MKLTKLLLFFLFLSFITNAQKKGIEHIDSLATRVLKYVKSLDKEKILLQTDRHIYTNNETIYFKLFPIDSITKQLTARPKKLYVDLVNNQDEVFGQLLLNAANLKTSGEFVLNDSLKEGYYWIRAYTEKMVSENLNDITVVPVYIVNVRRRSFDDKIPAKKEIDSTATPLVQIFPEGGNIISGINTMVGVKVTDQAGAPIIVKGIVKDNADSVYARFNTDSNGLSKFSFNPIWYHRYSIFVSNKNKYDSVAALPPINFFGGQIAVLEQTDAFVKVRIALEDSIYSKDYTTYLLGISADSICYSAIGKGIYEVEIPLNNFSHGINNLLLFNAKNQLLSERDIFIKNENYHLNIHADKDNYGARENARVDVTLTDKNNKPLLAALTFAVTDMSVSDTTTHHSVNTSLGNLSSTEADLVMLTHKNEYTGWIATDTSTGLGTMNDYQKTSGETYSEEKNNNSSFKISGTVYNSNKEPVGKKIITIFSKQNNSHFSTDTTDINGRFQFYFTDLNDSTQFVVQVSNLKGIKEDEYKVVFDTFIMPHFITPAYLKRKFYVDSTQVSASKEWLKPIIVKKAEENYGSGKRISRFSYIITGEKIHQGANGIADALLLVPGIHERGNTIIIGAPGLGSGGSITFQEPLVVLDGVVANVQGSALNFINSIPTSSIDFIEVLKGNEAGIFGMQGGYGAIVINTKSGDQKKRTPQTALSSFHAIGFHTAEPFPTPDYNNKETRDSKMPDLRKTIYWNGDIVTNKEGRASVNFFTADKPTTYLITITGISENGDKIYKTFTINRR